jgi:putative inorganic carbon (HCO3(-)) transporter
MHLGFSSYGPLIIYAGAIVAFLLSLFWRPHAGLYFLIPLLPMQTARYWIHEFPFGEKLVDFLLLGVILGLIFHSKRPLLVSSPLNRALATFIVVTYFALWEGSLFIHAPLPLAIDDPRFSDWKNFVEMMLLFFIAASAIQKPKQVVIVIGLMCLSLFSVNRSYHNTVGDRDFSTYSDSLREAGALGYAGENGMGAFQAEMAVFLMGIACFTKKFLPRMLLWGISLSCIYCLLLTFSRGGYLGFLVGLLVLALAKERKLLVVFVLILFGWQAVVPNAVRERVLMTYSQDEGLDSSAEERITIWQDALDVITVNPVLGTGFDTYQWMGRVGPYRDTHNYYLKVFLELGAVGLGMFFWLLWISGKMSWKLFRTAQEPVLTAVGCSFFAMLCCAVVVNFFGDRWTYLQVNGFLWVLLGVVARGLQLTASQENPEPETELQAGYLAVPASTSVKS